MTFVFRPDIVLCSVPIKPMEDGLKRKKIKILKKQLEGTVTVSES